MNPEEDIIPLGNITFGSYLNSNVIASNNISSYDYPYTTVQSIAVGIPLSVIVVMTIFGNWLVLFAVIIYKHLRNTTNIFIVNLAIADILLGILVLPFSTVLELTGFWPFGNFLCDVWAATDVLCCTASILSLCAISFDRYIGVTQPLRRPTILTTKRAIWICNLVWVLSIAVSIGPFFGWKIAPNPKKPWQCEVNQETGYVLFSVAMSFYIPLFVILFLYYRIYMTVIQRSKSLSIKSGDCNDKDTSENVKLRIHTGSSTYDNDKDGVSGNESKECTKVSTLSYSIKRVWKRNSPQVVVAKKNAYFGGASYQREKRAAKTLAIVVGVFIMCWFPFFFLLPLKTLCKTCYVPEALFSVIFWLGYCNSMMNPIIYASSHYEFKNAFYRILLRHRTVANQSVQEPIKKSDEIPESSMEAAPNVKISLSPEWFYWVP